CARILGWGFDYW
nr:immunoglobulin heavy chain junction region [Mus musculus]MBK4195795.1 immunoglobulin heavy chain junction region [Mus musculus]